MLEENDLPDASRPNASAETDRRALCAALLTTFTKGLCELHARPGAFTLSPGERPLACPLVRLQSTRGDAVTNRLHERLVLDNFARQLLPLLDGTRGKESLTKVFCKSRQRRQENRPSAHLL